MCGAFSDKWLDVARRAGKDADPLQVEWGQNMILMNLNPTFKR